MSKRQQRFDGRECTIPAGGSESRLQRIGELLQMEESDFGQRLVRNRLKPLDIGAVGPLRMDRTAMQPECEHLLIGRSLRCIAQLGYGRGSRDVEPVFTTHGIQNSMKEG